MSEKEIQVIADTIKKNGKKASADEVDSFLKKIGVLTKSGNMTRAYKKMLCTPIDQA